MRALDERSALLTTVVLAIAYLPVQSFLFLKLGGVITGTVVKTILGLGLKAQVFWLMRSANSAIWFAILGILFGVPLSLAAKTHVVRYWFAFVIVAIALHVVLSLWSPLGLHAALMAWGIPEYWLYFVGVLCFASVTPWVQRQFTKSANAAP